MFKGLLRLGLTNRSKFQEPSTSQSRVPASGASKNLNPREVSASRWIQRGGVQTNTPTGWLKRDKEVTSHHPRQLAELQMGRTDGEKVVPEAREP